jgi:hypothetical protein
VSQYCNGRNWPNAPQEAKTGIVGRPPPLVWITQWQDGMFGFEAFNGQDVLVEYSGHVGRFNPIQNWNWGPAINPHGINLNIRMEWLDPPAPNRFRWTCDFFSNYLGFLWHTYYWIETIDFWWTVPTQGEFFATTRYRSFSGPDRCVFDASLDMRKGTYSRLPTGFCSGA